MEIFLHCLKKKFLLFCIGSLLLVPFIGSGQVSIDSIKTAVSTCPNNGSITIFAHSAGALFYSIIAGPVTEPTQTSNVFNSLAPGNYTIQVSDGGTHTANKDTTITGNYLPLDFNPITISPYCAGGSEGKIIGNKIVGTGNGPFTWQLISPSPVTTTQQASDTFNNLSAGNYTVRLTDGCGSFRTIVATVTNPATPFNLYGYGSVLLEKVGCDSAWLTLRIQLPTYQTGFQRLPLTYKYKTKNGIYIPPPGSSSTIVDTSEVHNSLAAYLTVQQLLPNITYGDSVYFTVYNTCGDSLSSFIELQPYILYPQFSYNHCGTTAGINFTYSTNDIGYVYGLKAPVKYTVVDTATNTVIIDSTIVGDPTHNAQNIIYNFPVNDSVTVGSTYRLTVTDGCGEVFAHNYTVPYLAPPAIIEQNILYSPCIDSVMGLYRIETANFLDNPKLILLSGPATLGSTKPGFTYTDTYTYPDTLGGGTYIFLDNLTVGTYQYELTDDCGHVIFDSIVVTPADIISMNYSASYQKGCLGQNKIYYTISRTNDLGNVPLTSNTVVVTNISTGAVLKNQQSYNSVYTDSVLNVPSGKYEIAFEFQEPGYGTTINKTYTGCWTVKDTITIAGYQTPVIVTSNAIVCHSTIETELIPDSNKGVPPYQYEIISGPETFPVQDSNLFSVTQAGTYTARIFDVCGNASTAQVTVTGTTFPPINRIATNCNSVKLFYGSSSHYTYRWTKPDGTYYIGDTLIIDPVTPADTGIYAIRRITNINGCTDTAYITYHLSLIATHTQTIQYCNGIVVNVGSSTYNAPGVYYDTLRNINSLGCDSVIITSLVAVQKSDTNNITICKGSSITIGGNVYSMSGLYKDSVINGAGCYDLKFTNLIVKQLRDTVNAAICSLGSITIGTHVYNNAGTYIDTLTSSTGCDSIVVLNLSINPLDIFVTGDTVSKVICQGDSLGFGTTLYTQSGIYQDTIVEGCTGIVLTVNVTVNPVVKDSLVKSICAGQSYTVGPHTYNTTGIYRDTLSTVTSCDSIVVLNLTVNAVCAPSRLCSGATHVVWKDDFGSGTSIVGPPSPAINPAYIDQNYGVVSGNYSLVNYFNYQTCCWHKVTEDHTPNDVNGYFLVMDGGVPNFYTRQVDNLCPNTDYTFSAWTMNMDLPAYPSLPTFIFNVTDISGNSLGQITTPPLPVTAIPTWVQNGFTFNSGNNTSLKLNLILTSVGYNDFAFDDIEFSVCGPTLTLTSTSSACSSKVNLNAVLGSGYANPVYQWYKQNAAGAWTIITNANGATYTDNAPLASNWYRLTVSDGASACSFIEDSIQVTLATTPLLPVIVDSSICVGQSVFGYTATGQFIDTLKGTSGCDSIQRTLNLIINPLKRDTINRSICQGLSYLFGSKNYSVQGVYSDTLSTLTCDSIVLLNLTVTPALPIKIITNYTLVSEGDTIQLNTTASAPYLWVSTATISNNIIQDPTAIINNSSWIYLYATSNCPSVDSVFISVKGDSSIISPPPCNDSYILMPNAFTPNHDGLNDMFKAFAKNIRLESFQIYDRWGQMVFQTSDINASWDGNFQGQQMPTGNYVYWLTYYDCNHVNTPKLIKGNIILIR